MLTLGYTLVASCSNDDSSGCDAPEETKQVDRQQVKGCSEKPRTVAMQGTCGSGKPIDEEGKLAASSRPLGNLSDYDDCIYVPQNSLGFVRIRANANWSIEDQRNVIGRVPGGTYLSTSTETKGIGGIGYIVAVMGSDGQTCAGYVSQAVTEAHPQNQDGHF
ncbi:MAG: hypothetical protein JKY56_18465 [Kofleriaceae bacterium]|nr:hypothetical protein [Kofleriaceae bacterium]